MEAKLPPVLGTQRYISGKQRPASISSATRSTQVQSMQSLGRRMGDGLPLAQAMLHQGVKAIIQCRSGMLRQVNACTPIGTRLVQSPLWSGRPMGAKLLIVLGIGIFQSVKMIIQCKSGISTQDSVFSPILAM